MSTPGNIHVSCAQGNSSTSYSFEDKVQMRTDDKSSLENIELREPKTGASRVAAAPAPPQPARIIRPVRGSLLDSVRLFRAPGTRWHAKGRFKSPKLDRQAWHTRGHVS
jgi:hypothetical protein